MRTRLAVVLPCLCAVLLFCLSVQQLSGLRKARADVELEVALPLFVQVLMTGGDRFLAADVNVIRALISSTDKLDAARLRVLGKVQRDAAFLNPAHEDNYYLAAAILPWSGELGAAQDVLARAISARPFDPMPAFYYGFNLYYFEKMPTAGAEWMLEAARREPDVQNQYALQNMAARWFEKGNEPAVAIGIVEAMARNSRDPAFGRYLLQRAARLRALDQLVQAAARFRHEQRRPLTSLSELVSAGYVGALPTDPFGFGFDLDAAGEPILLNGPPRKDK
ncbi:MAG: hypothetical protein JSR42_10050 [Proteobacteria bacterium]|nr:hypothetical protein [Pseudomonadota bacterium]